MVDTRTPVARQRQQFINLDLVRRIVLCHGLSGTSRSVLLTVGMHANTERQLCHCSIATLARQSGWSRRTITEHLTRLQQLGYLSLIGTHDSGTSIYQVRLERLPADGAPVDAASNPNPVSGHAAPVPTPAPPPPIEAPTEATTAPRTASAHPPCANCAAPTHHAPTPHAPAAHKEGVEKGFEQQRKEEGAASIATTATPIPFPRAVISLSSSVPEAAIDANTIGQLNAQRTRNGKDPLTHRDIMQIGTEAAKADLTPLAAAQWVLAKPQRNFFKADFYSPPVAPSATPPSATARAAAQVLARMQPPATPLSPEEQAQQAAAAQAARARIRQWLANSQSASGQPIRTSPTSTSARPACDTRWASHAIEQFVAGHPVSHYRLHSACEVLGIDPRSVRPQRP